MTARSRRRTPSATPVAALAVGAVAALVLAGCGKAAPPAATPPAQDAVGGYRMTTVITASTISSNPAGPSSQVATDLFLSCADAACGSLLQRSADTGVPQGATVRLTPEPGGYGGSHVRTGVCGGAVDGSYGESYSWRWERRPDGSMTGTMTQVFKGCGLDGTATVQATANPERSLQLPYLPAATSQRLVAALNGYDTELSKVYVSGAECNTDASTTTLREAACFARTYAAWLPDIDRLGSRLQQLDVPQGACADAIGAVRFPAWSRAVGDAAKVYAAAHNTSTLRAGIKTEEIATSLAGTQHALLVNVAALCTDPAVSATLGKAGTLELDPGSALQPLDG